MAPDARTAIFTDDQDRLNIEDTRGGDRRLVTRPPAAEGAWAKAVGFRPDGDALVVFETRQDETLYALHPADSSWRALGTAPRSADRYGGIIALSSDGSRVAVKREDGVYVQATDEIGHAAGR